MDSAPTTISEAKDRPFSCEVASAVSVNAQVSGGQLGGWGMGLKKITRSSVVNDAFGTSLEAWNGDSSKDTSVLHGIRVGGMRSGNEDSGNMGIVAYMGGRAIFPYADMVPYVPLSWLGTDFLMKTPAEMLQHELRLVVHMAVSSGLTEIESYPVAVRDTMAFYDAAKEGLVVSKGVSGGVSEVIGRLQAGAGAAPIYVEYAWVELYPASKDVAESVRRIAYSDYAAFLQSRGVYSFTMPTQITSPSEIHVLSFRISLLSFIIKSGLDYPSVSNNTYKRGMPAVIWNTSKSILEAASPGAVSGGGSNVLLTYLKCPVPGRAGEYYADIYGNGSSSTPTETSACPSSCCCDCGCTSATVICTPQGYIGLAPFAIPSFDSSVLQGTTVLARASTPTTPTSVLVQCPFESKTYSCDLGAFIYRWESALDPGGGIGVRIDYNFSDADPMSTVEELTASILAGATLDKTFVEYDPTQPLVYTDEGYSLSFSKPLSNYTASCDCGCACNDGPRVRILNYIEPANLPYYGFLHFTDPDVQGTPYVGSFLLAVKGSDGVYEGVFNPKPNPDCDVPYVDSFSIGVEDKLGVTEGLWHPLPQGREKELFREGVIVATQPHYVMDPVTGAYPAGKNYGPKLMYSSDGVFYTCTCGCSCGWRQDHLNVKPWITTGLGGPRWLPWPEVTDMQAWGNTAITGICNKGDNTYDGVPDRLYMRYVRADCDGGCWRTLWNSSTHHPATILPDFSGVFFAVDANGFLTPEGGKIPDKLALFGRDIRTGKTGELRNIQKTGVITSYVYDKQRSFRRTLNVTSLHVPHNTYIGFPMYDTHEHEHHVFTRVGTFESDYVPSFQYGRFQEKVFDIRRCDCGVCDGKHVYADCSCSTREITVKGWASGKIRSMITKYAFQCVHDDYVFDCNCRCSMSDIHTYMYAYKSDEYIEVPPAVYLLRHGKDVEGICQCPDYDGRLDPRGDYFEGEIEPDLRDNFYTFTDDCGCYCKIAVGELDKHYSPSKAFTFGEEPYDYCPVKQFDVELRQPPVLMVTPWETELYVGTRVPGPKGIALTTADRTTLYKSGCDGSLVPFHTVCHTQFSQVRQYHDTMSLSAGKRVYVFDGGYQMQSCDCFAMVDYFPDVMTAIVSVGDGAGEYNLLRDTQVTTTTWSMSAGSRQAFVNYREGAYVFVLKIDGVIITSAMLAPDNYFSDSGVELVFGIVYQGGNGSRHAAWREVSGPLRDSIYRFDVASKPVFDPVSDCEVLPDTALITVTVPEVVDRCMLSSTSLNHLFWANGSGYQSSAIGGQMLNLGDIGTSEWPAPIAPHALRHVDIGQRTYTANVRRSGCHYPLPVDFDFQVLRGQAGTVLPPAAPAYRDIFAPTITQAAGAGTAITYDTCMQDYSLTRGGFAGSGMYNILISSAGSYRTMALSFDPLYYLLQSFTLPEINTEGSVYYDVTATFSDITESFMEVPLSEVGAYECGDLIGEPMIQRWISGDSLDYIVDNFGEDQFILPDSKVVAKKTVNHDCTPIGDWYPVNIVAFDSSLNFYRESSFLTYYGDYRVYGYTDLSEIPTAEFAYDTVAGSYYECHFEYDESWAITALVLDGGTVVYSCSDNPEYPQPVINVLGVPLPAASYTIWDPETQRFKNCADYPAMWHHCQTCDCGVTQMWDVEAGTIGAFLNGQVGSYLVSKMELAKHQNGLNKQLIDAGEAPTQHFGITDRIVDDAQIASFFQFLAIKQVLAPSTVTATLYNSCPFTPTPPQWDYGPYGMLNYDQDYSNTTLEVKPLNGKSLQHLLDNGTCDCYCCLTNYTPLRDFCLPKDDDYDPTSLPI